MDDFTTEQLKLMFKYGLNPDSWRVYADTKKELVLVHKRGRRRTLKKEVK
jgi:hypothetical protein